MKKFKTLSILVMVLCFSFAAVTTTVNAANRTVTCTGKATNKKTYKLKVSADSSGCISKVVVYTKKGKKLKTYKNLFHPNDPTVAWSNDMSTSFTAYVSKKGTITKVIVSGGKYAGTYKKK